MLIDAFNIFYMYFFKTLYFSTGLIISIARFDFRLGYNKTKQYHHKSKNIDCEQLFYETTFMNLAILDWFIGIHNTARIFDRYTYAVFINR